MNDVIVTVIGWVATTPAQVEPDSPTPYTWFRLASTPRFRKGGEWTDGTTEWFTVKAWRDPALNIAMSVRKGEPAIVHGKLRTNEWAGPDGPRSEMVIEAIGVGHDLMRGRATFARVVRPERAASSAAAADAGPDGAVRAEAAAAPGTTGPVRDVVGGE